MAFALTGRNVTSQHDQTWLTTIKDIFMEQVRHVPQNALPSRTCFQRLAITTMSHFDLTSSILLINSPRAP